MPRAVVPYLLATDAVLLSVEGKGGKGGFLKVSNEAGERGLWHECQPTWQGHGAGRGRRGADLGDRGMLALAAEINMEFSTQANKTI
jgi:hypothetical protein